jgi:hypothetical protein
MGMWEHWLGALPPQQPCLGQAFMSLLTVTLKTNPPLWQNLTWHTEQVCKMKFLQILLFWKISTKIFFQKNSWNTPVDS